MIIVVHLYGFLIDLDSLRDVCDRDGIILIEDCAQAIGASRSSRFAGSWGDFSIFSFQSQKNISTLGEGGILSINPRQEALVKTVKLMRHNGHTPFENQTMYWKPAMVNIVAPSINEKHLVPQNYCLSEIQCLIGRLLIKRLPDLNKKRQETAKNLSKILAILLHKISL